MGDEPRLRNDYNLMTAGSGVTAVLALAIPWMPRIFGSQFELGTAIALIFFLPVVWAVVTIACLIIYRRRALWLLLGAPVALFNLIWFLLTFSPCDPTGLRCL